MVDRADVPKRSALESKSAVALASAPSPLPAPEAGAKTPPSLLYLVKQLELAVRAKLDDLLRSSGITALQYTALTVLERHDGLSTAQLARASFVTAQSMADMVHALQERGLIRRERNPRNRRELLILLTDAGRAVLAEHAEPVRRLEERMVAGLGGRQIDQFRQTLTHAWHELS